MVRTWTAATSMFLTWTERLAVLVSLGPTPGKGVSDVDPRTGESAPGAAWVPVFAPGGTAPGEPAPVPLPERARSWAGAPPLAVPTVLVPAEPPLLHPASSTADRKLSTIRPLRSGLLADRVRPRDSRCVNDGFMTGLRGQRLTNGMPLG